MILLPIPKHFADFYRLDRIDIPLFLAGDFNGSPTGPIYKFFIENGFQSSYPMVHGREPLITHLDHNCSPLAVDYVFYRYQHIPFNIISSAWFFETSCKMLLKE